MAETILTFETEYIDTDTGEPALPPSELVLTEAQGREAMSSLYEYTLNLEVYRDGGLSAAEIDGLLLNECSIHQTDEASSLSVHGILSELHLVAARDKSPLLYRATLVPRLWKTTLCHRTRVFKDKNVQTLVDAVLGPHDIEPVWWLTKAYPQRECLVQFEETDFAFISRHLEHWGIFYFFKHEPDGEVLYITDDPSSAAFLLDSQALTFNPRRGRSSVRGSVHDIQCAHRRRPAAVVVREYNYRGPSVVQKGHLVDGRAGYGVHFAFTDRFRNETEGEMIAQIRSEQLLGPREEVSGICSVPGLAPGHKFELFDCPVPDLNITYLVTSVEPHLSVTENQGDEAYQYPFTAVPLERDEPPVVPYRAQRKTPWPKVEGLVYGFVDRRDGTVSPGKAAPIDELGRYKVIMPMDSAAMGGGQSSRKIRRVQPHAGKGGQGMHFPLHVGTEVAIAHINGDPDRPVIVGAVPNAATLPPVVEGESTKSRMQTRSGICVEIEDDAI